MGRGANKNYEAVHFEITGDQETRRNLRILGEKALSAVVKAAHAAAKPVSKDAEARAPKRYGFLGKSIGVKVRRYRRNRLAVAVIGARTGSRYSGVVTNPVTGRSEKVVPSKYLHLVEFGTDPHWVPTSLVGDTVVNRPHRHPGTKETGFLRAAFNANKDYAIDRAREVIEQECRKALQ